MTISNKKTVSSPEALLSSIARDRHVHRWFTFLITHRDVKAKLSVEENIKKLYNELRTSTIRKRLLLTAILCCLCPVVFLNQYVYIAILALLIYHYIAIRSRNKKQVIKISEYMLFKDFERSDICEKTLYQIGEEYSRKYSIPSLVDAVSGIDSALQRTLLATVTFFYFLYSVNHWQFIIFCVAACYLVYAILNTSVIYKRLRRS